MAVKASIRRVPLDRRVCLIGEERIDIRPSGGAVLLPLAAVVVSTACLIAIGFTIDLLPLAALALLLIPSLIAFPLGAMGLVYSLFGAHIIIDRRKQSATFQQGLLGLGLGTRELVPFAKIDHLAVEEASLGEGEPRWPRLPVELRGWEIVLVKTNGKRLPIGMVLAPEEEALAEEALTRARQVAEAIAQLVARAR